MGLGLWWYLQVLVDYGGNDNYDEIKVMERCILMMRCGRTMVNLRLWLDLQSLWDPVGLW